MNGSYGNCTQTQPIPETSGSIQQATAGGQMVNHNNGGVGSNGGGTTDNIQQHQYVYHQLQPESTSALTQNIVTKEEVTVSNFTNERKSSLKYFTRQL
jgi:hypothetical protein